MRLLRAHVILGLPTLALLKGCLLSAGAGIAWSMPAPWAFEEQLQNSREAADLSALAEVLSVTRSFQGKITEGTESALTEVELKLIPGDPNSSRNSRKLKSLKIIRLIYNESYLFRTCKKVDLLKKADIKNLRCNLEIAGPPPPGPPPVLTAPKPGSRVKVWLNEAGGTVFQPISSGWGWYEYDEKQSDLPPSADPPPSDKLNGSTILKQLFRWKPKAPSSQPPNQSDIKELFKPDRRELFKLKFSGIVEKKDYGCIADARCSEIIQGVSVVIVDGGWHRGFTDEVRASRIDDVEIGDLASVFCGAEDIQTAYKNNESFANTAINIQCLLTGDKSYYFKKPK